MRFNSAVETIFVNVYTAKGLDQLFKLIYRFSAKLNKISVQLFVETNNLILKFTWQCKGPGRVKDFWTRRVG